jgi:hypothetical protein
VRFIMAKQNSWMDKVVDNTISFFVTFFFSIGLIGSFSYLAFQANSDLMAASDIEIYLEKQNNDLEAANKMDNIYINGWFANQINWDKLANIVQRLSEVKQDMKLDPIFRQEIITYATQNQIQLATELGQIKGITINIDAVKREQEIILDEYQQAIRVLKAIEDMVSRWENETPAMRTEYFRTMEYALLEGASDFKAHQSLLEDQLSYFELEHKKIEKEYREGMDKIRQIRLRMNLSITGIVLGVLVFAFGLNMLYSKKTNATKKAKVRLKKK